MFVSQCCLMLWAYTIGSAASCLFATRGGAQGEQCIDAATFASKALAWRAYVVSSCSIFWSLSLCEKSVTSRGRGSCSTPEDSRGRSLLSGDVTADSMSTRDHRVHPARLALPWNNRIASLINPMFLIYLATSITFFRRVKNHFHEIFSCYDVSCCISYIYSVSVAYAQIDARANVSQVHHR